MNKICTSIDQSLKLIGLGIDVDTADMCYINEKPNIGFLPEEYKMFGDNVLTDYWPAWSLTALLNIIPKKINFGYENDSTFVLKPLENGKYLADYYEISFVKDNPVDTVFEMICWLKENGKI